jgi:methyl-accepting chemotaxis protein
MTDDRKKQHVRSLTLTLAATFLAVCTVILLSIVTFEIYFQYRSQQRVISGQLQIIATDAANTVKSFIQDKFTILETATNLTNFTSTSPDEQKLMMEKFLGKENAFRQLVLFDTEGKETLRVTRLSSFEPSQMEQAIGSEYLASIKKGDNYISQVYIDNNTSEPLVAIMIPVKTIFGDIVGALGSEVNLKFMWELVGSIKVGQNGQAYVVDKNGTLLACDDISRVLSGDNLSTLIEVIKFSQGITKNEVTTTKGIQGVTVITNHVPLDTPDWAVIVELPISEAYEPIVTTVKSSTLVVLLSLCIVTAISIYFSRKITTPLIKLRDASISISGGNLDTRIEIATKNEIGELAQTFNDMTMKLKQSYAILEQKVEERTKELEEAKKQMENVNVQLEGKVKERTVELQKLKDDLETTVAQRTEELNQKLNELEKINKMMVGRELKMAEMKRELEKLKGTNNYSPTPEEVMSSIGEKPPAAATGAPPTSLQDQENSS